MGGILILRSGTYSQTVAASSNTLFANNLQLHLDAGNTSSYSGSGTTWTDLVGSKTFTLYGSPTYSAASGGYINFVPASGQYAQTTTSLASMTNWTVEAWHYYTGTNTGASPCIVTEYWPNGTGNLNYTLGNGTDSSPNLQAAFFNGAWRATPTGTTLTANTWYHLAGTYNGSTLKLYVNGTLASNASYTGTSATGAAGIRLMRRWDNAEYWGGGLGVVRIYNSDIGAAGVSQNYNFQKSRFGVVTSGLQLNLSTAPSSGTTWLDTSGNGFNATLSGNTAYVSNNGGGIKLQNSTYGGDAYISAPYNITSNTATVELVASFNPTSYWATIWGNEVYNSGAGYFAFMSSTTSITYGKPNSSAAATITASNAIRHFVFVINGTSTSVYLNGSIIGTVATVTAQTLFANSEFLFGARHTNAGTGATDKMNSSTAANQPVYYQMRVYNKALSTTEITQNFNAVRSTYGI